MNDRAATSVWKVLAISVALAGLVWTVFGQTLSFGYVNFDDGNYVYRNPEVVRGITVEGIKWAFTHVVVANWHPLTMLSYMLTCSFFGAAGAGQHLSNVILHTTATILLFFVFWSMTGALWRSAFIAAVFAIHPLHVESVAWIAERKDVLSAVFCMLTIAAYAWYARQPSALRYLLVVVCFGLGLLSKPMLVTVPFVLLLLDYWPLHRATTVSIGKLLAEKVPLLALTIAACATTLISQHESLRGFPIGTRLANALVALMIYIGESFWPVNLAVFYPHPENNIPIWQVLIGAAFIVVTTIAAVLFRKKAPYLLVGWLWYLGMLVPVIGIVQVGIQAHADRYMYLPQIGLSIIVIWALANLLNKAEYRQFVLALTAAAALIPLMLCARLQVSSWRNSESLWTHAVAVTPSNEVAHEHLSDAYLNTGRIDDAVKQARQSVAERPYSADAKGTLGAALVRKGDFDEAIVQLNAALQADPKLPQAHYNLGNIWLQKGDLDQAIAEYQDELYIDPRVPEAHNNLARALLQQGKFDEAQSHLEKALALAPNNPEARNNLAIVLSQKGKMREAIEQWNKTVEIEPTNLEAQCNLAWIYATFPESSIRNGAKAVRFAESALHLSDRKNPRIWRLAAAAYAEAGRFDQAIKAAEDGLELAQAAGDSALVATLQDNIRTLQLGTPLRDVGSTSR